MSGYCPRCGSRLYPDDEPYMRQHGACSACITWKRESQSQTSEDHVLSAEEARQNVIDSGGF